MPRKMYKTPEERKAAARAREKAWRQAHPEKSREYSKRYYEGHREKEKARHDRYLADNPDYNWHKKNPEKARAIKERWLAKPGSAEKQKDASKKWRQSDKGRQHMQKDYRKRLAVPAKRIRHILNAARWRSLKNGRPFEDVLYTIHTKNIPKNCACCGTEFDYSMNDRDRHSRSPSFDQIIPGAGYTVANVAVICFRCNITKNDASLEELKLLVAYVERELASRSAGALNGKVAAKDVIQHGK